MYVTRTNWLLAVIILAALLPSSVRAQKAPTFQNFFLEGAHQHSVYGDLGIVFNDFPGANLLLLGGRIGFPLDTTLNWA